MVLIHFKHLELFCVTDLQDSQNHDSHVFLGVIKMHAQLSSLQDEPILRKKLSDFSQVHGLSDS
jgi:hypothetical protein